MANQIDNSSNDKCDSDKVENCMNASQLHCQRCSSIVLLPQKAKLLTTTEFYLPFMYKKNVESLPTEGETLQNFWVVDDMFTFENIGFSNTVDRIKYLICADCEIGPIGWHDISDKKAFYIAVDRIKCS
ncbi:hypothetical protein ScPMuIL_001947 [Solemya velum]